MKISRWSGFCCLLGVGWSLAPVATTPDLSGRWVLVQVMPAVTELPIVGRVELTTIVALLVDIEQHGTDLDLDFTYCFQDVRTNPPLIATTVPERFVASLGPGHATARLEEDANGWRFLQPLYVEVRGAALADPNSEPLPTEAYDPRVFDQDGDGHPGLTVPVVVAGILSGDTYVVHRIRYELEGWCLADGSIVGTIHWTSEQNVIGASDPLLKMSYVYHLAPDPTQHLFIMRRIADPDPCRAIHDNLSDVLRLPPG